MHDLPTSFGMIVLNIALRSLAAMVAMFLLAKLIGARQIAQLTFYDYISGITIGSLAAVAALDLEINIWGCLISMGIFGFACYASELLTEKSIVLRRVLTGTPIVVIDRGKIIGKNLKKVRYDVNDLLRECRCQGYFDISHVAYAILETNGKLSIQPWATHAPATLQDISLDPPTPPLCANVIIDGKVMPENLRLVGHEQAWLQDQLTQRQLLPEDVLLATADSNGSFAVFEYGQESQASRIFT